MSPSERALALILRAWVDWPGGGKHHETLIELGDTLRCAGFVEGALFDADPTPEGQALLDALGRDGAK